MDFGPAGRTLPRGATGCHPGAAQAPDDLRAFTTLGHYAARATGGTVARVLAAGVTPNYHRVDIAHRQRLTAVLRHATLPLIAFATPPEDGAFTTAFLDHDGLAAAVGAVSGLRVMTAAGLCTPLAQMDLSELHPAEHDQIRYWQPYTVGELLFNFWD